MKGRTIILDHIDGREAAALMVDGQLEDLLIDSDAPTPGTVYRARADRLVKGQGGMFLTTPDGPAFLRQVKGLAPGQELLVQLTGYAEAGKALPVSQKLLFKSRYAIITPEAPGLNISRSIRDEDERDRLLEIAHDAMGGIAYGLILRSACDGADSADIEEDILAMVSLASQVLEDAGSGPEVLAEGDTPHLLAWRDWTDPADIERDAGGFERLGVLDALETVQGIREPLSGGVFLFIEETRALVAVDVNTGADTSLAAGVKANMACAKSLARALRLRGLGGQIVIDPAPMPKKDRRAFETALRASFRSDSEDTVLVGWTTLGHFELQRKRGRIPLKEVLA
ncbi:ribonuclease E/G [Phaeobacter sp. HS012]|uniref:ribonuclease E/G n=1 Tax=Phaeobacter TaxID=302485 RepID=UPI000160F904|nr:MULTISPECIES: ribonuclease E/G [Phaeobacter]AFO86181.1 ribonuclease E/G family protein [Phaeobacter inhibens 2.10]AUR02177.1 ribonuclease E/G family protein [Phaeobacter inhibens]AXT41025.1 ribonuclease G [Phaeobacter inhibens]MBQ4808903.1 ribonuclease E/G [Phaeobacter sp. HS012]MBQ4883753.1 ribonuclease E/G [Phaeobacter sp. HS011]